VLGEGDGDYCVYEIVPQGARLPAGALLPVPSMPRFLTTQKAVAWLRQYGAELVAGKQVMIFKAMEILDCQSEVKTVLTLATKPKVQVAGPTEKSDD
jgi:hypothetical protein